MREGPSTFLGSVTMASVVRVFAAHSGTIAPPIAPRQRHLIGRFCVRVSTDVIDGNGLRRMTFKGYGPDKDVIVKKTTAARDKHMQDDDWVTDPLITTIGVCDMCDNRVEVYDIKSKSCYHLL